MSELSELTNAELRELLESKGLDTSGKKSELIARLEAAEAPAEAPAGALAEDPAGSCWTLLDSAWLSKENRSLVAFR